MKKFYIERNWKKYYLNCAVRNTFTNRPRIVPGRRRKSLQSTAK